MAYCFSGWLAGWLAGPTVVPHNECRIGSQPRSTHDLACCQQHSHHRHRHLHQQQQQTAMPHNRSQPSTRLEVQVPVWVPSNPPPLGAADTSSPSLYLESVSSPDSATPGTNAPSYASRKPTWPRSRPVLPLVREPSERQLPRTSAASSTASLLQQQQQQQQPRHALFAAPRVNPVLFGIPEDSLPSVAAWAHKVLFIHTDTLCDVFAAVCLARTALVLEVEASYLSLSSLGRLLLVFVPFHLAIAQMMHMHDTFLAKADLIHVVFTGFRLVVVFGLAWTAPSVFSVADDTQTSFLVFLFMAKGAVCVMHLVAAAFDEIWCGVLLVRALTVLLPVLFWIVAIISTNANYFLALGVVVDLLSMLFMDGLDVWFQVRRERLRQTRIGGMGSSETPRLLDADGLSANPTHSRQASKKSDQGNSSSDSINYASNGSGVSNGGHSHVIDTASHASSSEGSRRSRKSLWHQQSATRIIVHTTALTVTGSVYLFESRVGAVYPESSSAVRFSMFNFLASASGVLVLFALHCIYSIAFGWRVVRVVPGKAQTRGSPADYSDPAQGLSVGRFNRHKAMLAIAGWRHTMAKIIRWLHLPLQASLVVLVAGMQQYLSAAYILFAGMTNYPPRLPMDLALHTNLTAVPQALSATGIGYLAAVVNLAASADTPFAQYSTSQLAASPWTPHHLLFGSLGAYMASLSLIGLVSDATTECDQASATGSRFRWTAVVWSGAGLASLLRLFLAALLFANAVWAWVSNSSYSVFGLAALLVLASLLEGAANSSARPR
ncbi:hypothetical protein BC831DRAFT_465213 [Entophlyctis helioformis]|nr:hypothetical protein BC831DRAFT_465213 [Entophlyctis helioformis]